jgi:hypothetical protein
VENNKIEIVRQWFRRSSFNDLNRLAQAMAKDQGDSRTRFLTGELILCQVYAMAMDGENFANYMQFPERCPKQIDLYVGQYLGTVTARKIMGSALASQAQALNMLL